MLYRFFQFKNLQFLFVILLIFASCKKDVSKASIIGKWTLVHFYDKSDPTDIEPYGTGSYMDISEANIYAYYKEDGALNFTSFTAPYVREGSKLKFSGNESWEITTLTSKDLVFDIYDGTSYDGTLVLKK
jgi:hypothetical protein